MSGQRLFGPQVNWASQPLDYNLEKKNVEAKALANYIIDQDDGI